MSISTIVRDSLEKNSDVILVHAFEVNLSQHDSPWKYGASFYVAPKKGLYTVNDLQNFMMGLVPQGITPTHKDNFAEDFKKMYFGKIYFDEKIDDSFKSMLSEKELSEIEGYINAKRMSSNDNSYNSRTIVKVFPDYRVAQDILEGKLGSSHIIRKDVLQGYDVGLGKKILQSLFAFDRVSSGRTSDNKISSGSVSNG